MARRRLLWTLLPTYLVFIVLCSLATGLYAWGAFREFHLDQTARKLRAHAQLVRGQIAGPLDASRSVELADLCRRTSRASESRVTVIPASGQVLADSHGDPATMDNHAARPEVAEALAGRIGRSVRYSHSVDAEMMYVAVPLTGDGRVEGVVRVAYPLTDIQTALRDIYLRIGAAAIVVAVLAGLAAYLVARRLIRPLEEIRSGAARFARGELDHRLYVPRTLEIAELADSLNRMAGRLDGEIRTVNEQKARQEAMLASMIEGVVAIDAEQRVIRMNQAAADLLDTTLDAADGRGVREVIRSVELERLVERVLGDGEPAETEVILRKGDQERTIEVHATVLRDVSGRDGIGALLVFNDVTRLRRLEGIRRDFVANVSHELKTPITSIKGFVETLRDGAINDPERSGRFLEIIGNQADRLGAIIEDLLSLSRIEQETEKQEIRLVTEPVRAVLDGAVAVCQVKASDRNIELRVQCPANLSAPINAPLLEQAVANLIDNAIKYSEPGGAVRIAAAAADDGGVIIQVQDWGCGIARDHLGRLFERFYRVDKARSRKLGGTGLGLAIVKHIVSAHRGTVTVASTVGEGSTFTIRLPADH